MSTGVSTDAPGGSERRVAVLVVGAGPAGAAAGIELARAGVEVCVIDRARFPRPKTCGDALSNRAVRIVEGLLGSRRELDALPHAEVGGAAVVFPDGSQVVRRYADHGRIIAREVLDARLREALAAAGAEVLEGVAVRALTRDSASGRICGAVAEGGHRWRCRAVIAADGAGSVGRRAVAAPRPHGRGLGLAATAYVAGDPAADGIGRHYLDAALPCGYGWVFPAVDGLANVGVYQRADQYHRQAISLRDKFDEFVERRGLGGAEIVGGVRVWPLPLCASPLVPAEPGLLLCGDAAGLIDPLSGEGIWQALRSGTLAGRLAAAALVAGEGLSWRWVRRYQRACAREIGWPSLLRAGVQAALRRIVEQRLYDSALVRGLLSWAYGRGALEMSKV